METQCKELIDSALCILLMAFIFQTVESGNEVRNAQNRHYIA